MGFLNSLIVRIKGDNTDLKKSINDSNKTVGKFGSAMSKLGGLIAGAFAVSAIVNFTKEAIALAGQVQGVAAAFNKLDTPNLLADLRKATRGTVTDLVLMQKAVQAKNFKIPLEQLASYFDFATKRAIQTGESVDYLVDSLITGVGRKSVLVMDNLGISAVELQQEIEKVGDFGVAAGNIIRRELSSMGDVADTTAIKVSQISTSWKNLQTEFGKGIVEGSAFDKILKGIKEAIDGWAYGVKLLSGRTGEVFEMSEDELLLAKQRLTLQKDQLLLGKQAIDQEWEKANVFIKYSNTPIRKDRKDNIENLKEVNKQLDQIESALSNIIKKAPEATEATSGAAGTVAKSVAAPFVNEAADVKDPLKGDLGMQSFLGGLVNMNPAAIGTTFDAFTNEAVMQVGMMQDIIGSAISGATDVLSAGFARLFEGIGSGSLEGVFDDVLTGMAEFLVSMGKMMVAYGAMLIALDAAKKGGVIGAPVLIGAGLAAIAIGSLIKGAISKGPNLTGGGGSGGGGYGAKGGGFQTSTQTIQLEGVLKGSDILISNRRTIAKQGGQT
jgi:hypothetical protein